MSCVMLSLILWSSNTNTSDGCQPDPPTLKPRLRLNTGGKTKQLSTGGFHLGDSISVCSHLTPFWSLFAFSIRRVHFLLQSRVSMDIPVIPLLLVDSNHGQHILFLVQCHNGWCTSFVSWTELEYGKRKADRECRWSFSIYLSPQNIIFHTIQTET